MKRLTYRDGWGGGDFLVDGELFNTSMEPDVTLIISRKRYKAIYQIIHGSDYDHGGRLSWGKMHIGVLDGNIKKRFLSVADLKKHKVYIDE